MRPSSIASRKLVVGQSGSSIPTSRKVVAHVLLREMQCPSALGCGALKDLSPEIGSI
jgi:hypothetical protein